MKVRCGVCHHRCMIEENKAGLCGARVNSGGKIRAVNYGMVTSLALDPIEKKPLARFMPGKNILSIGSYGCNLYCPFCQNYTISRRGVDLASPEKPSGLSEGLPPYIYPLYPEGLEARYIPPDEICRMAESLKVRDNIGLAFTYNEPLVGYEYVIDAATLVKSIGMKNVLVTNGCVAPEIAERVLPLMDAVNVDLKSFDPEKYERVLGGNLDMVKMFIEKAAGLESCHLEVTVLVVPGLNDFEEEMKSISSWLASLERGSEIPLHISRYFPNYKQADPPTSIDLIRKFYRLASADLKYVYLGNC
jgi:pyruvate formate lyase activating enzyme